MPRFPPAAGVNRHQVAIAGLRFVEGEGDMGGAGVGSLSDTEDDLPMT
ncbi:hypothetical protein SHO565_32070 [Streptomyces sp. HO565]